MKTLDITVNGERVETLVEPRLQLADLLREKLDLTGTHLGCEQGVCGACTVLVDGVPVRSCITPAVVCAGAEVTSIEGFDDDPLMIRLRAAFTKNHALQCGFCTPGMLVMARDIVRRLAEPDEARIRVELSGNLCRCTGYQGIVHAIREVLETLRAEGTAPEATDALPCRPAGSGHAGPASAPGEAGRAPAPLRQGAPAQPAASAAPVKGLDLSSGTSLEESFTVAFPPAVVWKHFDDVEAMLRCIPGAALAEPVRDGRIRARMKARLGPIAAEFLGDAHHERDDTAWTGLIEGAGQDAKSGSRGQGAIRYRLVEEAGGQATRVELTITYALVGIFAQFARSGIVKDFVGRLTAQFAENLQQAIARKEAGEAAPEPAADGGAGEFRAGGLIWTVLRARLAALFAPLFGRR